MQCAYASAGIELPRTTYDQIKLGYPVPRYAVSAGDLIFSNFSARGPEHVQLAISPTRVVEAPNPGGYVQISAVPASRIVVKRLVDG
jgi:cell wall-associated NlpC family hydrolase